jgi:hypothetical protein
MSINRHQRVITAIKRSEFQNEVCIPWKGSGSDRAPISCGGDRAGLSCFASAWTGLGVPGLPRRRI